MTRYLKILVLAMLAVGLIASGAFAGSIAFLGPGGNMTAPNTPYSVALEAMGAARNLTMVGADASGSIVAPALVITPGQAISSGSLLTLSFTNAGFDGGIVYLCQIDSANNTTNQAPVGSATPSANSTSQAFVLSGGVASGNKVMLTANANSSNCVGNANFNVRFQPVSSAAMASVSYNVVVSGTTYDSGNAVNNIGNISRQYSTAYSSNTSYVDFLNSPANGSKFATNTVYTSMGSNANIANTARDVNTTDAPASLTVAALISLQDSASWQGVTSVYARKNGTTCGASQANNVANNSPSGTVNLALPAAVFNGAGTTQAADVTICAQVAGNAVLQTRTIKAAVDINVTGTGPNDPGIDAYTTIMQWQSNGYQGIIPYLSAQSNYLTVCFINNKGNVSGPVTADILTSESGATLTSLTGLSVGTLAAYGTLRVDFASAITPYTYSGGTESAGTEISLTGLQSNDRYTAMINVGASPTQITVNCIQLDPAGSKRAVPVLTQTSTSNPYQQ